MQDDNPRGIESPDTTAATASITETTSDRDLERLTLLYETIGGKQRKIRFAPTDSGEWFMTECEWNGCQYRETGFRRVADVGLEFGDVIPSPVARAVLAELFETALAGEGVTDLDVLNAIARETFDDETVAEAKDRARRSQDDEREVATDGGQAGGLRRLSNDERQERAGKRTLEAVRKLADAGETDDWGGGVPAKRIGEEIDCGRKSVSVQCGRLVEDGKLRRVQGVGPHGARPSYLPVDDGGEE